MVDWVSNVVVSIEICLNLLIRGLVPFMLFELEDGLVYFVGRQEDVYASQY